MAKFFFYTATGGQKSGPYTEQELRELVKGGVIKPNTPMENADNGHKFVAKQYDELFQQDEASPDFWQFDFVWHLRTCKAINIINGIVGILFGLAATFWCINLFGSDAPGLAFICIVASWVFVVFEILTTRMLCEWSLITSKAAQLYVERCEKE